MYFQHLGKKLSRFAGRIFIFICLFIIKIFPAKIVYLFSLVISKLAFLIARKRRNLTINNIQKALGNTKTEKEIKQIAQGIFNQIAWGAAEITIYSKYKNPQQKIKDNIEIEGLSHLKEAFSKNKGVIIVSAHFGNFSLLSHRLTLAGYPTTMIVRDANDPVVNELWYDVLNKIGASSISDKPRHEAVSLSIKQLKANKGLCLFCDQNKTDGVYVDFFGLPAGTVEGPALLAHRLRSPVLCAFIIRKALFKHKIVIIPLLDIEYTDNRQSDIKNITKRYTKIIEDFVRKYPNQWWWVHNRWKGMHKLKKRFK